MEPGRRLRAGDLTNTFCLVSEELERNVIVESSPSLQPRKEAGEESPGRVLQLESLPKRFRHNTYS